MHSFDELSEDFSNYFSKQHFPEYPQTLYEPNEYFLQMGGKRVRPTLCLMGNEMIVDEITADTWHAATAIELFHNFTLIHDDIMDNSPIRRGKQTVYTKYGTNTAILAGDVMLVRAYEYLNQVNIKYLHPVLTLFNKTATEVCEGQQLDMDFEKINEISYDEYVNMITLKTSVALATSLKVGALLAGTTERNQNLLYAFGKNLGIAFQVQDDYLDAFGNPKKFGKQLGGDILSNKKTFLWIYLMEFGSDAHKKQLNELMFTTGNNKVSEVIALYKSSGADMWAIELQKKYLDTAINYLNEVALISSRKEPLFKFAQQIITREV